MSGRSEKLIPLGSGGARDPRRCGAKAAALATAKAAGFPVLDGWILPADVVLTPAMREAIALEARAHEEWMVRSSASDEDGSEMSQAGRYLSERCRRSQVIDAVERVRSSGSRAVLLQRAVDGPGGVYLSQDPAAPHKPLLTLAREGVERVTGGFDFAAETQSHIVGPLYRLSRDLEKFLNCPVDVELGWNDGPLLFQLRPQTALAASDLFHEYFPCPLPNLALEIWADMFRYALGLETEIKEGRLYYSNESDHDTDPSPVTDVEAEEAARGIPALRDDLESLTQDVEFRSANSVEGIGDWIGCYNTWRKMMFRYFNNPVQNCLEESRRRAPEARMSDPVTRERVADLHALRRILVSHSKYARVLAAEGVSGLLKQSPMPEELRYYLEKWGSWSEYPEDFSQPYLDEDPSLLDDFLSKPSETTMPVERRAMNAWEEISCFGEEDNAFKYRACHALRIATTSLGHALARRSLIQAEDDIWNLSLSSLCRGEVVLSQRKYVSGESPKTAAYRGTYMPCEEVLSSGRVEGTVWFGKGAAPADPILAVEAIGQRARDLLQIGGVRGAICCYGTAASHGAIVARERRIAVVRSSAALRALKVGDRVLVDAARGMVVRLPLTEDK